MSGFDDLTKALQDAETLMDQAAAFVAGVPAATQAAVDAAKAGDDALAQSLADGIKAHADALGAALSAAGSGLTTETPPAAVTPA